ncbi:MAG: MMPL family transporter [Nevskiales bacterium]
MRHTGISSDVMFAHLGRRNVISMLEGSGIGLLAISIILIFALRSFKYGAVSLVANVLPIAVGFGIWGLLVGRIGMGMSVVAGMTLGIVVDYTVHLLSKYRLAQREQGLSTEDAIRYAFSTVGVALFVTTVILTANFGMLSFSDFRLNSDMGQLTAGIILIALVVDFFFLPPLLLLLDRKPVASPQAGQSPAQA